MSRALVLLAIWVVTTGFTGRVEVIESRNGVIAPGLPFRFEPFEAPRLAELRDREGLDAVVAGAASEWAAILRLKDWVAAQFSIGWPDPYPPWDALTILDWIRSGITGGFCGQYSMVLLQSLASFGVPARYIEVGTQENPLAHFLVEAWSNDYNKWVLLDADYNLHFERHGIPLSALEVHDALVLGNTGTPTMVLGAVQEGHPDPYSIDYVALFYHLRWHLKADHLTHPENPFDRWEDMVEWEDPYTERWPAPLTRRTTAQAATAYARLNQVRIRPARIADDLLALEVATNVFDFGGYEVAWTDPPLGWEIQLGPFWWKLQPGVNAIWVRATNTRGVTGPPALLKVRYQPGG